MSWRKNELFVLNWTINAKKSFYFANPSAFWLRKSADSSFHQASELGPWSGLKTWNLQKHEYVLGDLASKTLKNENWQLANPSYLNNVFFFLSSLLKNPTCFNLSLRCSFLIKIIMFTPQEVVYGSLTFFELLRRDDLRGQRPQNYLLLAEIASIVYIVVFSVNLSG